MQRDYYRVLFTAMILGALALSPALQAKSKKIKTPAKDPQDEIQVVGHIPVTGGPVRRFLATQHYSSSYLYAEHDAGKSVTLIDVTKITQPMVLANMDYLTGAGSSSSLFAVAGTAALLTEQQSVAASPPQLQTIQIMDFSDPQHPKIAREFKRVTAISRDDRRGLIFLANDDGIWILRQNLADDPEVQKAYAHHVLYDH